MAKRLDAEELRAASERILRTVLLPDLLAELEKVRKAPPEEFFAEASKRLTPAALSQAGINIPEDMRISSRYFDEGTRVSEAVADRTAGRAIERIRENASIYRRVVDSPSADIIAAGACVGVGVPPGVCACIGG